MVKAVIFDMDGVLIDSEPLHFAAMVSVLKRNGVNIGENELERFLGDTNERIWTILKAEFRLEETIDFYIEQQLESTHHFLNEGNYTPIDGVVELLESLKKHHIPMAIASSAPPIIISNFIDKLKIGAYFDHWVSGNEVAESKPAPYIYLKAVAKFDAEPGDCVAIEDSVMGVSSAKAAGLKCIGFSNPNAVRQNLDKADKIVNKISQINIQLINGLVQ